MRGWVRLSLVLSITGLLASRVGLLVHEFVGHGGMASALGGTLPKWRLFLFGGGWIRYNRTPWYSSAQQHWIALAGVGSELIFATLVWVVSTRLAPVPRAMLRMVAMLLCAHACVYIATGTHYGFGDGMKLHGDLAPVWREVLVVALSLTMAGMAYALAKEVLLLAALLDLGRGLRRLVRVGLSVSIATLLHAGLYYGERGVIGPDREYEAIMERDVDRLAQRYAAALAAQERLAGQSVSPQQVAAAEKAYVEEHEPWPLRLVLLVLGGLATLLGSWRFARVESDKLVPWQRKALLGPGVALAVTLVLILIVDAIG